MLRVLLPEVEWFDDENDEFIKHKSLWIQMEHSLVSVSQWESKWKKPLLTLLDQGGLSSEELLDYFGFMIIDPPTSDTTELLARFSPENMQAILEYLGDSQTATVIHERENVRSSNRFITSELVYTWMIGLGISKDFETWNVNRLMTFIRTVSIEMNPDKKKMKTRDVARMQRNINEINRQKLGTRG